MAQRCDSPTASSPQFSLTHVIEAAIPSTIMSCRKRHSCFIASHRALACSRSPASIASIARSIVGRDISSAPRRRTSARPSRLLSNVVPRHILHDSTCQWGASIGHHLGCFALRASVSQGPRSRQSRDASAGPEGMGRYSWGSGSQGARRCTNRSADQPDCAFAHLDRKRLQWYGAGRCLNDARQRLKRPLGTPHHLAGADVVARGVPWALQTSVFCHLPVAQRSEQVAAAVGQRERLARADANG